jgi:hypothetical protein
MIALSLKMTNPPAHRCGSQAGLLFGEDRYSNILI